MQPPFARVYILTSNDVEIAGHAGHCPLEIKIVLLLGQENGQISRPLPLFLTDKNLNHTPVQINNNEKQHVALCVKRPQSPSIPSNQTKSSSAPYSSDEEIDERHFVNS